MIILKDIAILFEINAFHLNLKILSFLQEVSSW